MKIANRMAQLLPSATLAVSAKAAKLRGEGVDVIAFGVGEPDFEPPAYVRDAAILALQKGNVSKYTPVAGTPPLRKAIAEELTRTHGYAVAAENVIVSTGAKHSLYNLFMAMLDDGDEVVMPRPLWVSYPEQVQMAGGKPVFIDTHPADHYRIDPAALERALSPRTRALLLNSPSNPTGAVYSAENLRALGEVVARHPSCAVITDDIYRRLTYGVPWTSFARVNPELAAQQRIVLVDGVSKTYAMTGWRIGWCAGPVALVKAMETIQGQSTTNATALAQAAALAAISGPAEPGEAMRVEFDRRRQRMVEHSARASGCVAGGAGGRVLLPLPDLSTYIAPHGPLADDLALAGNLPAPRKGGAWPSCRGRDFWRPAFYGCRTPRRWSSSKPAARAWPKRWPRSRSSAQNFRRAQREDGHLRRCARADRHR